jgi:hypothetical protein
MYSSLILLVSLAAVVSCHIETHQKKVTIMLHTSCNHLQIRIINSASQLPTHLQHNAIILTLYMCSHMVVTA